MYHFLQLIAVYWLGLHQLITCESSEQMSIYTDLMARLYMFQHLKVHEEEVRLLHDDDDNNNNNVREHSPSVLSCFLGLQQTSPQLKSVTKAH
jgi:hypothetical protein